MILLKRLERIKKNQEFQEIFRTGKSFANRELVIYYREKKGQERARIGISVGKRLGNAVLRNRIKRYIRESFNYLKHNLKEEYDIIIIVRKQAIHKTYHEILKSMQHILSRQHLLKKQ